MDRTGQLVYRPYGAALDTIYSRARELMFEGPAGTGKSRAVLEKINILCDHKPGIRVLIARKTRASMSETVLATLENDVLGPFSPLVQGAGRAHRQSYVYPNRSQINVGGLDKPERIMSSDYDIIYVPEATEALESDWEMLMTRLRHGKLGFHQIVGDCNPDAPTHWINNRASLERICSRHEDNPTLFDEVLGDWTPHGKEYIATLDSLSGHRKERLRYGRWVAPEGARFPNLSSELHQFDLERTFPRGLPSNWPIIMGLDYGLRAPYCALWTAIDEDKNLWVFREDYEAGITADVQAERFIRLTAQNEKIRTVYADPACWAKFPGHEGPSLKCTADFYQDAIAKDKRFGGLVPGFNKSRRLALDTIDALLNRGNEYPNLYIERKACPNLWRELTEAVWDSRSKDLKEDIDPACDDHAITAGYYGWHTYLEGAPEGIKPLPSAEEIRANEYRNSIETARRNFYRGTRRVRV